MEGLPSLQQLCLRKIASRMWREIEIRKVDLSYRAAIRTERDMGLLFGQEKLQLLIDKMATHMVNRLGLPKVFRADLRSILSSKGLKIYKWSMINQPPQVMLAPKLPAEFGWTAKGKIDVKKTIVMLADDEQFELEKRFQLACIYDQRECVYALWKKQLRVDKILDFKDRLISRLTQQQVIKLWTRILSLEDVEAKTKNEEEKLTRWKNALQKFYDSPKYNSCLF